MHVTRDHVDVHLNRRHRLRWCTTCNIWVERDGTHSLTRLHTPHNQHRQLGISKQMQCLSQLKDETYVAFVECKLSLIWSLHLLHPGELQVTKTARYLRLQTSRTCYLTSASRSRARAEYARIPPHFRKINPEAGVYFINFFLLQPKKITPSSGLFSVSTFFFCWVKNKLDFFSRTEFSLVISTLVPNGNRL